VKTRRQGKSPSVGPLALSIQRKKTTGIVQDREKNRPEREVPVLFYWDRTHARADGKPPPFAVEKREENGEGNATLLLKKKKTDRTSHQRGRNGCFGFSNRFEAGGAERRNTMKSYLRAKK